MQDIDTAYSNTAGRCGFARLSDVRSTILGEAESDGVDHGTIEVLIQKKKESLSVGGMNALAPMDPVRLHVLSLYIVSNSFLSISSIVDVQSMRPSSLSSIPVSSLPHLYSDLNSGLNCKLADGSHFRT